MNRGGESLGRRASRAILTRAVRGRRAATDEGSGGVWGEAVLGEFEATVGSWPAIRWAASGLRVVWRERWARWSARPLTVKTRLARRVLPAIAGLGALAVLANWLVVTVVYLPSSSMNPTFQVGDRLLVDKIAYRMLGLDYDDLVVVDNNRSGIGATGSTVRRIIGLPGDVVACADGHFARNGSQIDLPQVAATLACPTVTVEPGQLYLVGDNADIAIDSRQLGAVPDDAVVARVITPVWHGSAA